MIQGHGPLLHFFLAPSPPAVSHLFLQPPHFPCSLPHLSLIPSDCHPSPPPLPPPSACLALHHSTCIQHRSQGAQACSGLCIHAVRTLLRHTAMGFFYSYCYDQTLIIWTTAVKTNSPASPSPILSICLSIILRFSMVVSIFLPISQCPVLFPPKQPSGPLIVQIQFASVWLQFNTKTLSFSPFPHPSHYPFSVSLALPLPSSILILNSAAPILQPFSVWPIDMQKEFLSVSIKLFYFYSLVKEQGSSLRVSVVNVWSVKHVYVWACCAEMGNVWMVCKGNHRMDMENEWRCEFFYLKFWVLSRELFDSLLT